MVWAEEEWVAGWAGAWVAGWEEAAEAEGEAWGAGRELARPGKNARGSYL